MKKIIIIIMMLGILVFIWSCKIDHGLGPIDENTGISGTITFVGAWPEPGSMMILSDIWLFGPIAHTEVIPKDSLNIFSVYEIYNNYSERFSYINYDSLYEALEAQGENLTAENCTVRYDYEVAPIDPGTYKWIFFIAIPNIGLGELDSLHYYIMATYYDYGDSSEPGQVLVEDERMVKEINMTVDFNVFHELIADSKNSYSANSDYDKNREVRDGLFK
ncbi:hypothetical protein JXI42_12975 [bacterium]|nr:hypothetical protein [bacterium]